MKIILTDHAKQRMIQRDIKRSEIEETIELPEYTVSKGRIVEAHKNINGRSIKIVYSKQGKFIKIISVMIK